MVDKIIRHNGSLVLNDDAPSCSFSERLNSTDTRVYDDAPACAYVYAKELKRVRTRAAEIKSARNGEDYLPPAASKVVESASLVCARPPPRPSSLCSSVSSKTEIDSGAQEEDEPLVLAPVATHRKSKAEEAFSKAFVVSSTKELSVRNPTANPSHQDQQEDQPTDHDGNDGPLNAEHRVAPLHQRQQAARDDFSIRYSNADESFQDGNASGRRKQYSDVANNTLSAGTDSAAHGRDRKCKAEGSSCTECKSKAPNPTKCISTPTKYISTNECDKKGRCVRHPQILVTAGKKKVGRRKIVVDNCPACCALNIMKHAATVADRKEEELARQKERDDAPHQQVVTPTNSSSNKTMHAIILLPGKHAAGTKDDSSCVTEGTDTTASNSWSGSYGSRRTRDNRVVRMPYTDRSGDEGWYTGEVDIDGQPHGKGVMKYRNGRHCAGVWIYGRLIDEPCSSVVSRGESKTTGHASKPASSQMSEGSNQSAQSESLTSSMGDGWSSSIADSSGGSIASSPSLRNVQSEGWHKFGGDQDLSEKRVSFQVDVPADVNDIPSQ